MMKKEILSQNTQTVRFFDLKINPPENNESASNKQSVGEKTYIF